MKLRYAFSPPPRFAPSRLCRGMHLAFAALAAAAIVGPAGANPVGGVVVGGHASILQPSPSLTQINQSSQRAVIDWRSFSIGVGEAVRFNQPSTGSATLNRVVGNDPSSILGSLSANGHVYLVNQNGVFIGRDAHVDAAALVLSTANVSNSDFMAGRLNFNQPGKPGARIVNEGRLTAADGGLVAMVAPGVENRGVISARLGQVILAGTPTFSLDLFGDGLVNILLSQASMSGIMDASGQPLTNYVSQSGRVIAEGGRIWISAATARGLVNGMVSISGELRATKVAQQGGEITLLGGNELNISGSVLATGSDGMGGSIGASADRVVLASNAVLDASGQSHGGTVLVGGSYQGASPVPGANATASSLNVAQGASIKADATGRVGNGGLVVLWSENETRYSGSVTARAGAAGGNGGLMEVSGKRHLAFEGQADASSPQGIAGTLLLDPGSLTVAVSGGSNFNASGADSIVAAGVLNSVLRTGTSVTLQADDNINVNSQIDGRPIAGAGIGGGGLALSAGGTVTVNSPIVLNDGAFISSSASFSQANDNIIATLGSKSISISTTGNIATQHLLTTGDLNLSSTAGNISVAQPLGGTAQPIGSLTIAAPAGNATLTKGIFVLGDTALGARNVQVGQAGVGGELRIAAGSNFELQGDAQVGGFRAGVPGAPIGSFSMVNPSGGTAPQLDADLGGILITASSIGTMGALRSKANIELNAGAGDVTLGRLETTGAGSIAVGAAGNIVLPDRIAILTRGGNIALASATGEIDASGTVAANDPQTLAGPEGKIRLTAPGNINVNQLVGTGRVDIVSTQGSINLRESLGGKSVERPTIGALHLSAWKDVATNGLNLAGSIPGTEGLSIEAGTGNTEGGHIYVNDRIGVSNGDLRFGSNVAQPDGKFSARLFQGVYARNGNQKITFNVPLVTDGERIFNTWQRELAGAKVAGDVNPTQVTSISPEVSELLQDMLLIPAGLNNTQAEGLVSIARRALYVVADNSTGRVTAICPQSGCPTGTNDVYIAVPKILVSAQEESSPFGTGRIELNGGISLSAVGSGFTNSALELRVPLTEAEKMFAGSQREIDRQTSFQTRGVDTSGDVDYTPIIGNLALNYGIYQPRVRLVAADLDQSGFIDFSEKTIIGFVNASVLVHDPASTSPAPTNPDPVSISQFIYPGPIALPGPQFQGDIERVIPSGILNLNSGSSPASFSNVSAGFGGQASLTDQILAQLPPVSTLAGTGTGTGTGIEIEIGGAIEVAQRTALGEVVAAVADIERSASLQPEALCPGRERQVVGRSAGDEADVGATSALQGAPRPVFRTIYALGEVSNRLATADGGAIAGVGRATPCL